MTEESEPPYLMVLVTVTVEALAVIVTVTPGAPGLYWPLYGAEEYWPGAE